MAETQASAPLKIGIAGLGTVGGGLVRLIDENADLIEKRAGRAVTITTVSARDRTKDRGFDVERFAWHDDAVAMAAQADIDILVELIGGSDGPAKAAVETALGAGRSVVTANKALIAHHGLALAALADKNDTVLAYEAAVAGGIPIIKAIREGLAGNRIAALHGILNGTCNYILTTMRESGRAFDDVLAEAQDLGYAEADPSFDIDGVDAAHKLAILASIAFGTELDFDGVYVEGIRMITPDDILYAEEIGYRIKLLGVAEDLRNRIQQRVHPVLTPLSAPIASVEGVYNAVVTQGDFVGATVLEGRGAGDGPTASAVIADIMDIAAGRAAPAFGLPVEALTHKPSAPITEHQGAYYVRLEVIDQPGVMADVTAVLRDEAISLENVIQRGRDPGAPVSVAMTTHETTEAAMQSALNKIGGFPFCVEPPRLIRIEQFG
ncbi:MAG: homoserine dehydrogenase [Alphaproteobacteria bacterium]|nr:homoserine dehydrogenase [Alphaproteobacteria bacterium]